MKLHTIFKAFACVLTASGLLATAAPVEAKQRLRVAGNFPTEHSASKAMEVFKKEVEAATKGQVVVDLFPNMMLGGASENIDQVRSGTVFGIVTSVAYFSRIVPEFEAVSLPFLFSSRESAFRVVDGKVGTILDQKLSEKGFKGLGYGELGFRNVTNSKHPIAKLEDFKDLKLRLQPNEVHLNAFRHLGANPVAMDISEVYSALQQGVLDGQENPYNIIATRRFDEVQKYLSNSSHFFDYLVFVANKAAFERLHADQQKAVQEAAAKAMAWQRNEAASQDENWRKELVKRGMQYTEIAPEDRAAMRKAVQPVVDDVKKRIDPVVIDAVLAEVKE